MRGDMGGGVLRRLRGADDEGVALIFVLATMGMLTLFLLVSLGFALKQAVPSRRDQDAKTAVMAAEAGLDEYVSRLNANSNYWQQGNGDSTNLAFTSGQVIPGTGSAGASFTYTLLSLPAEVANTGTIRLKVTGTSKPANGTNPVARTLTANLKPSGFLDYVYLSDVEVVDPDLAGDPTSCGYYYYAGRSTNAVCDNIQWGANDVVNGPLHSNDALQVNGSTRFLSPKTESSWPAIVGMSSTSKTWWGTQAAPLGNASASPPTYAPKYAAAISIPAGNTTLATKTTPGADGAQTGPGCYYKGATRIVFTGTTMKVLSPNTSSGTPTRCLDVSTLAMRQTEQTVAIPPVIYVDSGPACTAGKDSGGASYSITGGFSGVGYPASGEKYSTPSSGTAFHVGSAPAISTNYTCTRGSVYVSGTVDAQVTVAALDDIVVTGDLKLADNGTGTDVIGLCAGNDVWIYHPLNSSNANLLSTPVSSVYAAILSLRHSFVVQNWGSGSPTGTLNVTGGIAQKFRGAVGTSSGGTSVSGYAKNYVYDPRFTFLQPPYFLAPDDSPWYVSAVTDK